MRGNLMSLAQAREYVSKLAVAEEQTVKRVETKSGDIKNVGEWKVIYNKTDNHVASIPTRKYQLVQHGEFFNQVLNAIEESEFDTKHIEVKDARERVDFEIIPVNAPTFQEEQVAVGIRASNSIDTSIAARIQAYGLRLICMNGMIGRKILGGKSLVHIGGNVSREKIRNAIEKVIPIAEKEIEAVIGEALDTRIVNAKKVLEDSGFGSNYVKEIIKSFYSGTIDAETGEVHGDLSAWSLYCAATEIIDHKHVNVTEKTREELHRTANQLLPTSPLGDASGESRSEPVPLVEVGELNPFTVIRE